MTRKSLNITLRLLLLITAGFSQLAFSADLPAGARYVALGSSFAAGPGVEPQLGTCGRSAENYANLVAGVLRLDLTDVSCNGATTDNILDTPQNGAAPQIEAVNAATQLVTVTIGGNDIRYTASTFACSGKAARERCTANLDQAAINEVVRELPTKLTNTVNAIKARAPEATIVIVTYPRVFLPDAVSCDELQLSAEDTAYLAYLGTALESAFVSVAASENVLIADSYPGAAGHGPCQMPASQRWVNGATVLENGIRYHPTAAGHQEMARLVLAALAE